VAEFVRVASVDDIPEGAFRAYEINFTRLVIAHTDEGFFAFADECSHDSEPFGRGELTDHEIVCPRHGARFDIRTGAIKAPPAVAPIDTYEIKLEGNDILVKLD
jgi:3-phenylpropionate/trans-cinnamate dioxygenase ferredoxin subunit